jgi:hypothetical protein
MKSRNNNFDWEELNRRIDRTGHLGTNAEEYNLRGNSLYLHMDDCVFMRRYINRISGNYIAKKRKRKKRRRS